MSLDGLHLKGKVGEEKHTFPLHADQVIIGSGAEADIIIPVDSVDARHASLTWDGAHLLLADLGSRGGTFRNGRRLLAPLQVFPGDEIGLGPEVTLTLDGDPPLAERDAEQKKEAPPDAEPDQGTAV